MKRHSPQDDDHPGGQTQELPRFPALTEQRPWGWAMVYGGKPVENRTWPTNHRGRLIIHHGGGQDRAAATEFAPLAEAIAKDPGNQLIWKPKVILGSVVLTDCHRAEPGCCSSPWAMPDQWHWILADPIALQEPIPTSGALRLWTPGHAIQQDLMTAGAFAPLTPRPQEA